MQDGQLDLLFDGYESFWNYAEKKGYSGTAIFSRRHPLHVSYGIGQEEHDHEGRVITLEMEEFFLVNVYVPNAQDGLRRLDYRMKWEDDDFRYAESWQRHGQPLVDHHDRGQCGRHDRAHLSGTENQARQGDARGQRGHGRRPP